MSSRMSCLATPNESLVQSKVLAIHFAPFRDIQTFLLCFAFFFEAFCSVCLHVIPEVPLKLKRIALMLKIVSSLL